MNKLLLSGSLALIALSSTACGRMADLEAPQARETERAPRDASTRSLPDPATINRPSNQVPIDGGPPNPLGSPAAGREPQ